MTRRVQLFANRFLIREDATRAIDLATGHDVRVQVASCGGRAEHAAWATECARRVMRPNPFGASLVDFGVHGEHQRFEIWDDGVAHGDGVAGRSNPPATAVDERGLVEWLTDRPVASPRVACIWAGTAITRATAALTGARAARLEGLAVISTHAWDTWRECLAARSLCILGDDDVERGWRCYLEAILRDPRGHALVHIGPSSIRGVAMLPAKQALVGRSQGMSWTTQRRPEISRAADGAVPYGRSASSEQPAEAGVAIERWRTDAKDERRSRLERAQALISRGRHAAGIRALRDAVQRFHRRDEHALAAEGGLIMADALAVRGETRAARAALDEATTMASAAQRADLLLRASVLAANLAIDDARLDLAEPLARSAWHTARGLIDRDGEWAAIEALARTLFWQGEFEPAATLLDSYKDPSAGAENTVRRLALRSRIAVGQTDLSRAIADATAALDAARAQAPDRIGEGACAVAFAHLAVGDLDAVAADARVACSAARAARRPLVALRAQLLAAEAARRQGRHDVVRRIARRCDRLRRLPAILGARVALLTALASSSVEADAVESNVRRTGLPALRLFVPIATLPAAVRHVVALLECCQGYDDEMRLLGRICERVRASTHAGGVWFAVAAPSGVTAIGGDGVAVSDRIVERIVTLEQPVVPHAVAAAIEGGAPVRYGGAIVGVIAGRWTIGRETDGTAAMPLLVAAAAAGAPALVAAAERKRAATTANWDDLLGVSPAMRTVQQSIERAATAPFAVLIEGESGVGKEVVARALHRRSLRSDRPWFVLNCAAIPDDLVESELFGHARGAFTGALAERIGAFEAANGGTLFLDEVGELSLRAQAKLLRTIQEGEIRRVGDNAVRRIDVRLIAATNRDLAHEVEAGRFRLDLHYRLDVVRIVVPPLRERREDIPVLADRFWRDARERVSSAASLGADAVAALARYDWPGNVRELQNVLAALAVRAPSRGVVGTSALPSRLAGLPVIRTLRLDEARRAFEMSFVRDALARAGGRQSAAAAELGLSRQGLAKLIERLGVAAGR